MRTIVAIAAVAAAFAFAGAPTRADDVRNTIVVSGYGKVEVPAQFATVSLGVVVQGRAVSPTTAEAAAQMARVIAAMKGAGIAERDMQTSEFDVSPRYAPRQPGAYDNDTLRPIIGYAVSNTLAVKVRDMANVSRVIDTATAAGANTIGDIGFGIKEDPALMDRAREKAVADALHRAQVFARAANLELGPALAVTEGALARPTLGLQNIQNQLPQSFADFGEATPIMARRVVLDASITVIYSVK